MTEPSRSHLRSTFRLQTLEAEHAKVLAKALRESAGRECLFERGFAPTPADAERLRGIPAIGRGCDGGAIRGTRPGGNLR